MKWRKITCLFTIMISGVALASCGGSSQGETSNLITTSNLNASGNGENANSALAGTDAALVSGENLAVYNNFKSSSTDIEEIMEQIVLQYVFKIIKRFIKPSLQVGVGKQQRLILFMVGVQV